MFRTMITGFYFLIALALVPFVGCGDNDDKGPTGPGTSRTFTVQIKNVSEAYDFSAGGAFDTPVGAEEAGPIGPGGAYEFRFGAAPGSRLSFATMFVHSNDLFYAPAGGGIALFGSGGDPVNGDVTDQVFLWDAGTEENEEPGVGVHQAPRQAGPDTGPVDMNSAVRLASDGYDYPAVNEVIRVTVTSEGGNEFTVRIENVSTEGTITPSAGDPLSAPLAPGVFVVHMSEDPIFTSGAADRGEGLEALAEDGNPATLAASLGSRTGVTTPLAPGVWAVHTSSEVLFVEGMSDGGHGLEGLAEDGSPAALAAYLAFLSGVSASGAFDTPVDAGGPAPIFPGESYLFTFTASDGDRLSFATMFVQSNDLFYAPEASGLALFDASGDPVTGDVTSGVDLWDAGTEANQWPGVGPDQAPRQACPDSGALDTDNRVRRVDDGFAYPDVDRVIRVTLSVTD